MALELYYDGQWNDAPVYARDGCVVKRGTDDIGNDTEPASGSSTIDNRSGDYSPRSLVSGLKGKIGQNTKSRYVIDGDVVLTGEMASWRPERDVGGDAWTKAEVGGVLRRIGRGKDAFRSPLARAYAFEPPDLFWMLDDPKDTTILNGTSPLVLMSGILDLGGDFGVSGATSSLWAGKDANGVDYFGAYLRSDFDSAGFDPAGWQVEFSGRYRTTTPGTPAVMLSIVTASSAGPGTLNFILNSALWDGGSHHVSFWIYQSGADTMVDSYRDGVYANTQTIGFGTTLGVPVGIEIGRAGTSEPENLPSINAIAIYSTFHDPTNRAPAAYAWRGETAGNRFTRVCTEQGITPTVVGDANDTVPMWVQPLDTFLGILDEIARTDDASIFETRDSVGLTMRTGASRMNQAPDLTVSYIGEVQPPLRPEYGDRGIRNDVTAIGPVGPDQRVEQATGPRNIQAPEDDSQGVGRYATRIDVNPSTVEALYNAAGWRVAVGCFDGTWYAEITVDLDAAPHLSDDVAAIDIGDVLELTDTPEDESLDSFRGLIVGIRNNTQTHRRLVTFYCIPAEPYQVGVMALTTGDTDPFVGHLETDGTVTLADIAAGATSFNVATVTGPLWTLDTDDFPFDVIIDGQRVSLSAIRSYIKDPYTRSVSNGWGTEPSSGLAWTTTGTASQFSVNGTTGLMANATKPVFNRAHLLGATVLDFDVTVTFTIAAAVTGAGGQADISLRCRFVDSTNFVDVLIFRQPTGITWTIHYVHGGVGVDAGFPNIAGAASADSITVRFVGSGTSLYGWAWKTGATPPTEPMLTLDGCTHVVPGSIEVNTSLNASVTNALPLTTGFDNLEFANSQTFTVQAAGYQVAYPIAAGASVIVQQPIILTQ